ncbi:MAG TPA: dienelactone hydrolase family protein [Rhabdochlamydiaceae bacterium]|nr:dienelactone hydrolase family protein [Rhabdochlamydiaceae bacterium]
MHIFDISEKGQPLNKAAKALILLHGRGSNALDIMELANEFCDASFYIAAPQATKNRWYPKDFMAEERLNEPWLSSALDVVKRLIDETAEYIPTDKIYLMGFSQGACLALETASRFATKYGGIVAFSGGLIGKTIDEKKYGGDFQGTKVFIGVSEKDPHIPLIRVKESKKLMEKLGAKVILKVYEGNGHTITDDEINQVKKNIFYV